MNFSIIKLEQYYDIGELQSSVSRLLLSTATPTISLSGTTPEFDMYTSYNDPLSHTALSESDFTHLHPSLYGSIFHDIWQANWPNIGRFRIMTLYPGATYPLHFDADYRHHLAIYTNVDSYLHIAGIDYSIPIDGHAYLCNTKQQHTAINRGETPRIHLVWNDRNCE